KMLEFFRGMASDRKLRLFVVACCRRMWDWLRDPRSRRAVELGELYADGGADAAFTEEVRLEAWRAYLPIIRTLFKTQSARAHPKGRCVVPAAFCAQLASDPRLEVVASELGFVANVTFFAQSDDRFFYPTLLRDLVGNPFRPAHLDPAWLAWNDGT